MNSSREVKQTRYNKPRRSETVLRFQSSSTPQGALYLPAHKAAEARMEQHPLLAADRGFVTRHLLEAKVKHSHLGLVLQQTGHNEGQPRALVGCQESLCKGRKHNSPLADFGEAKWNSQTRDNRKLCLDLRGYPPRENLPVC